MSPACRVLLYCLFSAQELRFAAASHDNNYAHLSSLNYPYITDADCACHGQNAPRAAYCPDGTPQCCNPSTDGCDGCGWGPSSYVDPTDPTSACYRSNCRSGYSTGVCAPSGGHDHGSSYPPQFPPPSPYLGITDADCACHGQFESRAAYCPDGTPQCCNPRTDGCDACVWGALADPTDPTSACYRSSCGPGSSTVVCPRPPPPPSGSSGSSDNTLIIPSGSSGSSDNTLIIIISVVAALVVIGGGIVALVMHQKAKALPQPPAPMPPAGMQTMPQGMQMGMMQPQMQTSMSPQPGMAGMAGMAGMPVQGVPQMAPAFDPDTGRPLPPSVSSSAGGSMRFDPNTGKPLPKFDPETGLANY